MNSSRPIDYLRASGHDPAKEARIARNLAQRALIAGRWGQAQWHLDAALSWEQATEDARRQGLRLVGESAGSRVL